MKSVVLSVVGLAITLGGCASVNPVKVSEAAPVTYKLGEGGMEYASARRSVPTYSPSPVMRDYAEARPVTPRIAAPIAPLTVPAIPVPVTPEADEFDAKSVDKELYAHQRIGKRYTVFGKSYTPRHQPKYDKTGTASWYGPKFHGKPTASGEAFDMNGLSAAHKTLPLNSLVHVMNVETGKSLTLRVNDRGPFVGNRIIDLSKAAARELGLLESGLKKVRVRYAGAADPNTIGKIKRKPKVAPAPVIETPEIEDAPAQVVEVPQPVTPKTPEYTPLRRMSGNTDIQPVAVPEAALPRPMSPLATPTPDQTFEYNYTPQSLPERSDVQTEDEGGPLTLTIKGPIHMAKSMKIPNPEYIRAANYKR